MKQHLVPVLTLAAALSLTACGATQSGPPAERIGTLNVSLLRVSESDFPAYDTPEALAADRPIVLAGVIDGWKPDKSTADFEKAMPSGTRILAYPREMPNEALSGPVKLPGDRLPRGARLMTVPPQGLILEDPALAKQEADGQTSLVGGREPLGAGGGGWLEPKTMDELIARLRQHGITE